MRRALVISGGGSKGAFAIGVLKKLSVVFPKLDFDLYVGTSTGALIAPYAALHQFDLLEQLYTTQHTQDIIIKGNLGDRLNADAIFDSTPLWNMITNHYTDDKYTQIKNSGKKLYLTTTSLQTGQLVVFTTDAGAAQSKNYTVRTLINGDHFRKAVLASGSQPVVMPPVKVNLKVPGEPNPWYQYVDGGVREYAGVQMAIDNGATEIFVILLAPAGAVATNTEFKTFFPILLQTLGIFSDDVSKNDLLIPQAYNEALTYVESVKAKMLKAGIPKNQVDDYFSNTGKPNPFENKQPLKIFIIRPLAPIGGGPNGLDFDPAQMQAMVQTGEIVTGQFIASLDPGNITWV